MISVVDNGGKAEYNIIVSTTVPAIRMKVGGIPRNVIFSARGYKAKSMPRRVRLTPFILAAVACALIIPFIIMNELRTDPEIAEWWTVHIAQGWERALGVLTSFIPVSIFELLACLAIIACVFLFVRLVINLCKAYFRKISIGFLALCVAAMCILDLYMLSMGFGYYRYRMPRYLAGETYNAKQAVTVVDYFLADYNALAEKFERDENGCVICPYSFRELAERMADEFSRLTDPYFFSYTPTAKPVTNGWFLSASLITGITFLPTGEVNVNTAAPPTAITYTMAHELAHAKGVSREGEANLISYYILLSSDDDYLRYCGYFATFYSFIECADLADDRDSYVRLINSVSPLSDIERGYAYNYWKAQPDIIGQISEFFNNWYLESNGVSNGTGSYDDGNQSGTITPVDPDTNEPIINPDTQKPVVIPIYSEVQKTYFYIYEQKNGVPPSN